MTSSTGNSSPIRVLLWSAKGSGAHYGGPGMSAYRLYSAAEPQHFKVALAHGYRDQVDYNNLFTEQHLIRPFSHGLIGQWRFISAAKRWMEANFDRFDVFHGVQGFHHTLQPAVIGQRRGLPAVLKLASHRSDLADKSGWRSLLGLPRQRRKLIHEISGLIAISSAIADELREYGYPDSKIARIPDGVDVHRFVPADAAEKAELKRQLGWPDRPTVVFVGGLVPRKCPHLLVEAIGLLKKRGLECQVVMAGPDHAPEYTAEMKRRSEALHISSHVIWAGFSDDIAPRYRTAEIYSLPSKNEGLPNALLEAMSCGLPSIVTAISGTTDLISEGVHGRFVDFDAEQIADAIAHYVMNPQIASQHGAESRKRIVERYSVEAVLAAHERLFRRIMAGGTAAE